MSQQNPDLTGESTSHDRASSNEVVSNTGADDAPKSLREYAQTTVINTVPPLLGYYGLRLCGVTPYLALVGAIVVATAQGLYMMVRKRKVEPLNIAVLLCAVASLTVAFTTKNPRIVQCTELIPVTTIVWSLVASGLARKPASKSITGAIVPSLNDAALPQRGWTRADIDNWHKLHSRLSVRIGILCGLFPVLAVAWIFTMSPDLSQILIMTVGPGILIASIGTATTLFRKFVRTADQAAAERAGDPADVSAE